MGEKLTVRAWVQLSPSLAARIDEIRVDRGQSHSAVLREAAMIYANMSEQERARKAREAHNAAQRRPARGA